MRGACNIHKRAIKFLSDKREWAVFYCHSLFKISNSKEPNRAIFRPVVFNGKVRCCIWGRRPIEEACWRSIVLHKCPPPGEVCGLPNNGIRQEDRLSYNPLAIDPQDQRARSYGRRTDVPP